MVVEALAVEGSGDILAGECFAISAEIFDAVFVIDFAEIEIFHAGGTEGFVDFEDAGVGEFDFFSALAGDFDFNAESCGDFAAGEFSDEGNFEILSLGQSEQVDLGAVVVLENPIAAIAAWSTNGNFGDAIQNSEIDSPKFVGL